MTQKRSITLHAVMAILLINVCLQVSAQDWKKETKINVLFGLSQPLLCHGFNTEFNYIHKRLIIDFSTGVLLEFKGNTLPSALRGQGIDLHMPWTTGFGVGYRLTEWLNIRMEPKWHRFEYYYDDEAKYQRSEITAYNTFTLGIGVYGSYQPFKNSGNFLKGITIAPSIRYWPTVASSLKGNQFTYADQHTGASETIKTYGPGIGLTPLVINVSVGYSFRVKNKG